MAKIEIELSGGEWRALAAVCAETQLDPGRVLWLGLDCYMNGYDPDDYHALHGDRVGIRDRFERGRMPGWAQPFDKGDRADETAWLSQVWEGLNEGIRASVTRRALARGMEVADVLNEALRAYLVAELEECDTEAVEPDVNGSVTIMIPAEVLAGEVGEALTREADRRGIPVPELIREALRERAREVNGARAHKTAEKAKALAAMAERWPREHSKHEEVEGLSPVELL